MPRINYASSMIVEDHLKQMLSKTQGKFWKPSDNFLLPRRPHCVFGDFPKEMLPRITKDSAKMSKSPSRSPTKHNPESYSSRNFYLTL